VRPGDRGVAKPEDYSRQMAHRGQSDMDIGAGGYLDDYSEIGRMMQADRVIAEALDLEIPDWGAGPDAPPCGGVHRGGAPAGGYPRRTPGVLGGA